MNPNEWRKLIRDVIAESKKSPDPIVDRLTRLGLPVFKKKVDSNQFWKVIVETLETNGYIVNDLSYPESSEDVEHNRKLVRLLSNSG